MHGCDIIYMIIREYIRTPKYESMTMLGLWESRGTALGALLYYYY